MSFIKPFAAITLLACSFLCTLVAADPVPSPQIPYQGRLIQSGAVATGSHTFAFSIIDATQAQQWTSGNQTLTVTEGLYSILLGGAGMPPIPTSILGNAVLTLQITVDGAVLTPNVALVPSLQAISAWSAENVTGTVAIANGGTGATTRQDALTALTGMQMAGAYLRSDGMNVALAGIQAADVPTLNQNTTGSAANVTGTVGVANGGTGATTAAAARASLGLAIGTDVLAPNGSAANLTNFPTLNQNTTGTATNITGTVAVVNGGTGATTQQGAITALTGTQTIGTYLRSDGTNAALSAIQPADVPTLNQNTTGTAANVTGMVAVANGGTGATSAVAARTSLGLAIGTDVLAPNGSAANLTGFPTLNQNTTGTATNVTGTVAVANGGTGATTQQAAINTLAGGVTSGQYLRGNGTNVGLSAIQAADVPTLNQNTTGTATNVTGTVAVANGGTGATTAVAARTSLGLAIGTDVLAPNGSAANLTGFPTLNQNTTGTAVNVTGTVAVANGGSGATTQQGAINTLAGGVTSGQYLRGNGTNVGLSAIQAADVPILNQNTTGTAANVTGTVAVANGGTGATTAATARTSLGLAIGTDVLAPNGSAANLSGFPTLNQNTTGTAANVTGTVAVANGGTGATTHQAAINALAGGVTSGQYLRGNGTNVGLSGIQAADVPTLNQDTTGTAANVTGTVAVAHGGTGATTLTGYVYGNGAGAMTASATIPGTVVRNTPVVDGASAIFTPDASSSLVFSYTLTGASTLNAPTNMVNGQSVMIKIAQDATGGRSLAFSGYKWSGGLVPSVSAVAGAVDVVTVIMVDGLFLCSIVQDIK